MTADQAHLPAHEESIPEGKLQVTNASTQLKRKLLIKVQIRVTLKIKFHIVDETLSLVKIMTDMQVYDCSIEAPRLIASLYRFALTMNRYDSTDQNGPSVSKQRDLKMKAVRLWFTQYGMQESLVLQWTRVPKKSQIFVNLNRNIGVNGPLGMLGKL